MSIVYLFTDFGYDGPYSGEVRAVLSRALTHQRIVDLMHDAPRFNPKASAYLIAALSRRFEYGDICLTVVDPGVGDADRRAILVEVDGITYIGPDNGLLSIVSHQGQKVHAMEITWRPNKLSNSFHGRDLFAPLVIKAALRESLDTNEIKPESLVGGDWPICLAEVIYIDHYGNIITGLKGDAVNKNDSIAIKGKAVTFAEIFSRVKLQELFWYVNSMGLVEIACNQGSAAQQLKVLIGEPVSF